MGGFFGGGANGVGNIQLNALYRLFTLTNKKRRGLGCNEKQILINKCEEKDVPGL